MDTVDLSVEANKRPPLRHHKVTVLYGDFGKRKTTTACSMVGGKGLLLSSDDSWKVLLNDRHADIVEKITVIEYQGVSQLKHIDFSGYDTFIWDTFSRSVDTYIDLLYDEADWGGRYREKLVTNNKELRDLRVQNLAAIDYRVTRDIFRASLNSIFKLPLHIVFTSQVNEPMAGLSPSNTKKPAIPQATFKILAQMADIIGYIKPVGKEFTLCMEENTLEYLGKSRIEGLEGKMPLSRFVDKYKEIVF